MAGVLYKRQWRYIELHQSPLNAQIHLSVFTYVVHGTECNSCSAKLRCFCLPVELGGTSLNENTCLTPISRVLFSLLRFSLRSNDLFLLSSLYRTSCERSRVQLIWSLIRTPWLFVDWRAYASIKCWWSIPLLSAVRTVADFWLFFTTGKRVRLSVLIRFEITYVGFASSIFFSLGWRSDAQVCRR
jgi:hypothetical protein